MRSILIASCLFSACASVPLMGPDLDQVHVYPKASIEMGRSSFESASGTLKVQIENRGQEVVTVGAVSITVTDAEGQAIPGLSGTADGGGESLGASEGMSVSVPLKWDWPKDQAGMLAAVERKLIKLRVEGTVTLSGRTVKIHGPSGVAAPVLPLVLVRHVEATREGDLSTADLGFRFEVRNDNFFSVKIDSLVVDLKLEGVEMAKGQVLTHGERVSANQSVILELSVTMDSESHPKKVRKLLRRGNLGYHVLGKVRFHGLEQPVEIASEIQFPEL
jgi:LEA14-like dessication related protein